MLMCCSGQQGDTSVPATPCNVLEMMRQDLEEKDSKTISLFSEEFTEKMSVVEGVTSFTREINSSFIRFKTVCNRCTDPGRLVSVLQ